MQKYGVVEDNNLICDLRKGNETAFNVIFKRYYAALCAYASRFVEFEDAESIVQDLMTWIWENREYITIESSLSNYLFRSVYNRTLTVITRKEVEKKAAAEFYMRQNERVLEDLSYYRIEELTKRIEEAIQKLPDSYREAFVMHRFKNMTYKEIAVRLNVSSKTIDYRIQQALKQLRVELKDYLPLILIFFKDLL